MSVWQTLKLLVSCSNLLWNFIFLVLKFVSVLNSTQFSYICLSSRLVQVFKCVSLLVFFGSIKFVSDQVQFKLIFASVLVLVQVNDNTTVSKFPFSFSLPSQVR